MPRVLRIINRFNLGGPTYNAAYLTKYLEPEFETLLIGGFKDDSEDSSEFILDQLGVDYQVIPEMRRSIDPFKDRAALKKVKRIIKEFQPDIVHTHASKAGAIGRRAASEMKVPVIIHTFHGHVFHSYFSRWKTGLFKRIERNLSRRTNRVIALSEEQRTELVEDHRVCTWEQTEVIPLGFDLSRFDEQMDEKRREFRSKWKVKDDEFLMPIVGRLVPIKGHQLFLDAFRVIKDNTQRRIKGFIVGDGESKEDILQYAREKGLKVGQNPEEAENSDIVMTSWEREVDKVLAGADLVALTSFNEGTPVSLIEAQASGKPVVSTNVGGIASLIENGVSGYLLDDRDPQEFADRALEMIQNDVRRNKMGEKGREAVLERFSVDRLVRDMRSLYRSVLEKDIA